MGNNRNVRLRAVVTDDGFFTGDARMNGERTRLEGRIDNGDLVGGLFTDGSKCAWLLRMKRQS